MSIFKYRYQSLFCDEAFKWIRRRVFNNSTFNCLIVATANYLTDPGHGKHYHHTAPRHPEDGEAIVYVQWCRLGRPASAAGVPGYPAGRNQPAKCDVEVRSKDDVSRIFKNDVLLSHYMRYRKWNPPCFKVLINNSLLMESTVITIICIKLTGRRLLLNIGFTHRFLSVCLQPCQIIRPLCWRTFSH